MWIGSVLTFCWALVGPVVASMAPANKWMDLTHPFDNTTLHESGVLPFVQYPVFKGYVEGKFWLEVSNIMMSAHVGTHMEAPYHVKREGWSLEDIPVDRFIAHAIMLDISYQSGKDPNFALSAELLYVWKQYLGQFRYPTVVMIYTGRSQYWHNAARYYGYKPGYRPAPANYYAEAGRLQGHLSEEDRGRDRKAAEQNGTDPFLSGRGVRHHVTYSYPGISVGAAHVMAKDPAVVGVAIDTASVDPGRLGAAPAQRTLAAYNIFSVANVADMKYVPHRGATVLVMPMKLGKGSSGPCRVLVRNPPNSYGSPSQPGKVKPPGI